MGFGSAIWRILFISVLLLLKNHHYSLLALAAILSLFGNIAMMSWSIGVDKTRTNLDTRPYVSVDMANPIWFERPPDTFYGNNITLKNTGRTPAAKISTIYYVTTDLDKTNMHGAEWYEKNQGGFGSVSLITPGATEVEPGFRSLSPNAQYYYFEAVTSYEGLDVDKIYWTHIRKVFFINRNRKQLYPVYSYGDWDRNRVARVPALHSTAQVVGLLGGIKTKVPQ